MSTVRTPSYVVAGRVILGLVTGLLAFDAVTHLPRVTRIRAGA